MYFELTSPDGRHNDAFSAYALHLSRRDAIVDEICEALRLGQKSISIETYDDLSPEDIDYIKEAIWRRLE